MTKKKFYLEIPKLALLFFLASFIGWSWETLYFYVVHDGYYDRGFLSLPWCPIYGTTIIVLYLLLGTPSNPSRLLSKIKNKFLLYGAYFFLAGLIPTIFEICVGIFFEKVYGEVLWTYYGMPLTFVNDYICLPISIGWGFAITLAMQFIVDPFLNLLEKKNLKILSVVSSILGIVFIGDCLNCFIK